MAQMKCIVGASEAAALQVQVRQQGCDNDICHCLWWSSLLTYACTSLVGEGGMVCLPWVLPLPLLLILLYLYYPRVACRPAVWLVFTVLRGSR
jgi:hypothetical protein